MCVGLCEVVNVCVNLVGFAWWVDGSADTHTHITPPPPQHTHTRTQIPPPKNTIKGAGVPRVVQGQPGRHLPRPGAAAVGGAHVPPDQAGGGGGWGVLFVVCVCVSVYVFVYIYMCVYIYVIHICMCMCVQVCIVSAVCASERTGRSPPSNNHGLPRSSLTCSHSRIHIHPPTPF
jgi:hypothetical protein